MRTLLPVVLLATTLAAHAPALADIALGAGDGIESLLRAQNAKRVTLRLRSGQEVTGVVRAVNARVVHLGAITGRDFFDAVVPLEGIDAVLVRVK